MSDIRPSLHQPPNPDDLGRVAPGTPECARVRGMLRDFADADLAAADRHVVEEHVHQCHVCSVELARAEHEVLRLRRAFAGLRDEELRRVARLPSDFAARVVERLLVDDASVADAGSSDASTGCQPSGLEDANREPMNREPMNREPMNREPMNREPMNREPSGRATAPAAARFRGRARRILETPLGMVAVAVMLLMVFASAALWLEQGDRAPDRVARLVLTRAEDVYGAQGRRLASGDGLGEDQSVLVGTSGEVSLDWHDVTSKKQPAATLEMRGNGQVRLEDGTPQLLSGNLHIETNRPVSIGVADGSTLELGIGQYVVTADALGSFLGDQYVSERSDPMWGTPGDLRVEIEVLRGEPARIVRAEVGPALVAAGSIGIYEGSSSVGLQQAGVPTASANVVSRSGGGGVGGAAVDSPQPTVAAAVYERQGLPSVGTELVVAYAAKGAPTYGYGVTGSDGVAVMPAQFACETSFAIVHAVPALARLDLGMVAPDAYQLVRNGVSVRCSQPLVLDASAPLSGTVQDQAGMPRIGVRLLPCVVDELLRVVLPWSGGTAFTNAAGNFLIQRLPASLPHHQYLAVLLMHPELEPTVVPVPVRGSVAALQPLGTIVMRELRTVFLNQLPPNSVVRVLEEVPGLPATSAAWQRTFNTDHQGRVQAALVGQGELWVSTGSASNPLVQQLVLDTPGAVPRYRPSSVAPAPRGAYFGPLLALAGSDLLIASSFRHERFQLSQPPNAGTGLAMLCLDALGRPVPSAQVFAVTPSGPRTTSEARFLGFTSAWGAISLLPVLEGGDLVVIGPDGSTSFVSEPSSAGWSLTVPLAGPGRVLVGPGLRPNPTSGSVLTLRFERTGEVLPGMIPMAVRFASAETDWEVGGLPPGVYRVHIGQTSRLVSVPEGGFVSIH